MSELIDDLAFRYSNNCTTWVRLDNKLYIAKDMPFYGFKAFLSRVNDAFAVLADKARAYHFKEDEL